MTVVVDGASLTVEQVERVARARETVALSAEALERMRQSRGVVEAALARGDAVYGMTTGLGEHKRHRLAPDQIAEFNRRLIENHRVGHGPAAREDVVRATTLRLLNGFAKATVGVRPLLAERLVDALNGGELPPVRSLGSAGEADLAPLADLAHGLFGDIELVAKEGLALVNNNSFSTALAALALTDARRLLDSMTVAGAVALEAFVANLSILDPIVSHTRAYPGLRRELALLRRALSGSYLWDPGVARNLQDPLSYRTIAQVHGAARDALGFACAQLAIELNAHHDNPIIAEDGRILSAGNFEALPIAAALDFVRIALVPVVTSCLERSLKLLQAPLSGLPAGLSLHEGLNSGGLGAIAYSAHALTAEARLLAQPVSVEVVTTTQEEGIADRITLAPLAGRRLIEQIDLAQRVLAIALVCSTQALDLRPGQRLAAVTDRTRQRVRNLVAFAGPADPFPTDLEPLVSLIAAGELAEDLHSGLDEPAQ